MKKILVMALVCFFAWNYYSKSNLKATFVESKVNRSSKVATDFSSDFTCDWREHCSQMSSFEEALFFINYCPNTKMDGDHDGVPCERQFGK